MAAQAILIEQKPEEKVESLPSDESERAESEMSEVLEEEGCFQDISLLEMQGISVDDINKLKIAGIKTVKGVQMTMGKHLIMLGFKPQQIKALQEACDRLTTCDMGFVTAAEVSEQRKQIFKLSTGSCRLNKLLGGGIEAMSITEVFGENRSGKTQLAHTLCVTAQMPGPNYTGGKVLFIDTERTFRPDRLKPIAERFDLDQSQVLENILVARAHTSEHQFNLLNKVAMKLHEEAGLFKILIIDSIMALFRVDYNGRGEMADRQTKLGQMLSRLKKLSDEYNIAIFITNQVTSDFSTLQANNNLTKPVGGNILAHASTIRLCFKTGENGLRKAVLLDSPDLEENEVEFIITSGGIDDPID